VNLAENDLTARSLAAILHAAGQHALPVLQVLVLSRTKQNEQSLGVVADFRQAHRRHALCKVVLGASVPLPAAEQLAERLSSPPRAFALHVVIGRIEGRTGEWTAVDGKNLVVGL